MYQYDVAMSPEVPSKGVRRAIIDQGMSEHFSDFGASAPKFFFAVFDGSKTLYSLLRFPLQEIKFDVVLQERGGRGGSSTRGSSEGSSDKERRFKVVVKEVGTHPVLSLVSFLRGTNRDCPMEVIQVRTQVVATEDRERAVCLHSFSNVRMTLFISSRFSLISSKTNL